MAELKTKPNAVTVEAFLDRLDEDRQIEVSELIDIMSDVTGETPVMWGPNIVGFGKTQLTYASGRELEWLRVGFSPRKGKLSLYLTTEAEAYIPELEQLGGKYSIGKGCVYIRKLKDVNLDKLRLLVDKTYRDSFKV